LSTTFRCELSEVRFERTAWSTYLRSCVSETNWMVAGSRRGGELSPNHSRHSTPPSSLSDDTPITWTSGAGLHRVSRCAENNRVDSVPTRSRCHSALSFSPADTTRHALKHKFHGQQGNSNSNSKFIRNCGRKPNSNTIIQTIQITKSDDIKK